MYSRIHRNLPILKGVIISIGNIGNIVLFLFITYVFLSSYLTISLKTSNEYFFKIKIVFLLCCKKKSIVQ